MYLHMLPITLLGDTVVANLINSWLLAQEGSNVMVWRLVRLGMRLAVLAVLEIIKFSAAQNNAILLFSHSCSRVRWR